MDIFTLDNQSYTVNMREHSPGFVYFTVDPTFLPTFDFETLANDQHADAVTAQVLTVILAKMPEHAFILQPGGMLARLEFERLLRAPNRPAGHWYVNAERDGETILWVHDEAPYGPTKAFLAEYGVDADHMAPIEVDQSTPVTLTDDEASLVTLALEFASENLVRFMDTWTGTDTQFERLRRSVRAKLGVTD